MDISLNLPYADNLRIEYLSHIFDGSRVSTCYKYFWFLAILKNIDENKNEFTYDELITNMVADAWYMVNECNLRLGPTDTVDNLEEAARYLYKEAKEKLPTTEKREKLIRFLRDLDDKRYVEYKKKMIENVPYCLQSPFFTPAIKNLQKNKIDEINGRKHLIYYFYEYNKLQTKIRIEDDWTVYFIKNRNILIDWTKFHLVNYLQARNPSAAKVSILLEPPLKRDLVRVTKYWNAIIKVDSGLKDIYGKNNLKDITISIDHFIPWQFVAHDELWNLTPTTKNINSQKNNNIAKFDTYFQELLEQEYRAYELREQYMSVKAAFENCRKYHVNDKIVNNTLYKENLSKDQFREYLLNIIKPEYQKALNCGFKEWEYKET